MQGCLSWPLGYYNNNPGVSSGNLAIERLYMQTDRKDQNQVSHFTYYCLKDAGKFVPFGIMKNQYENFFSRKGIIPIKICVKVEIYLEQREVAFLSPSKICENLNFSTEKAKTNKNEKWDEINISKIVY